MNKLTNFFNDFVIKSLKINFIKQIPRIFHIT